MRRGIRAHVVGQRRRDAAALEVHPVLVGDPVRFPDLSELAPESTRTGPRPVMIEETVAQLVEQYAREHVPRDLVATALAGDIAAGYLAHLWRPRRNPPYNPPQHL